VQMLEYVRGQLPFLAPMIVVSLAGVVLSLRDLKRLGKPAALALTGCGIVFLATSVIPLALGYVLYFRENRAIAEVSLWVGILGMARTLLQAVGFGVLLAAVFEGRTAPASAPDAHKTRRDETWEQRSRGSTGGKMRSGPLCQRFTTRTQVRRKDRRPTSGSGNPPAFMAV
jgi:hypothetical protein